VSNIQLLSIKAVSARIGRSRSSIYVDIKKGIFPPPLKISPRASRWRVEDIEAWINSLPVADLSEGGGQ